MMVSKIQSVLIATGFIILLMVVGLSIGLTAISAFSSGAEAMTTVSSHNISSDAQCGSFGCDSE